MAIKQKKILITGGAGFIGSHLAERLLREGSEVFVIDNLSTGSLKNISHLQSNKKFHFIKDTILNKKAVEKLVKKVDQIYHLAAAVGVKTVMEKPLDSFLLNLKGTEIVLEAASKRNTPILIASTSEVYGKNSKLPFKEEDDRVFGSAYQTRWSYGMSKAADEFMALAYHREKGLPVVIVRIFNVIGPRQTGAYGMVVPRFVSQAISGRPITIYGSGSQTRCFVYIDDLIEGFIALMAQPKAFGQIFNIGSDSQITIKDLARTVKRLTASRSRVSFIPFAKVYGPDFVDMEHRRPDISKIKKFISWEPKTSLEESLKRIIEYYNNAV